MTYKVRPGMRFVFTDQPVEGWNKDFAKKYIGTGRIVRVKAVSGGLSGESTVFHEKHLGWSGREEMNISISDREFSRLISDGLVKRATRCFMKGVE